MITDDPLEVDVVFWHGNLIGLLFLIIFVVLNFFKY